MSGSLAGARPRSRLEALLRAGHFVVTAEMQPSNSADPDEVRRRASELRGRVDAANCTDNPAARPHLCSVAAGHLVARSGLEPIVQLTCRDRNRLALQSDLLGAACLGARNVLLLTGDDVSVGDHPESKPLFDLDSLHLLRVARILREQGTYLSGRPLSSPPSFFIGAVENPFAPPHDFRPVRLGKKVEAGAEFVQLQLCFNLPRLRTFLSRVCDMGLLERVFILVSVYVARSTRALRYLRDVVPGIDVPDAVMARLERAPSSGQAEEGFRLALETVAAVREIRGVSGIHLISIKGQDSILRLVETAGLLPRPEPEGGLIPPARDRLASR
ncbi:MAG: methylenetetrahydrofolate reductase [Thermoanaerobaculia bacterium]